MNEMSFKIGQTVKADMIKSMELLQGIPALVRAWRRA